MGSEFAFEDLGSQEIAKYSYRYLAEESCGKCIPCRVGTTQMYLLLERIQIGKGTAADLALLEELRPDLLLANIPWRLLQAARQAGVPAVAEGDQHQSRLCSLRCCV